jgi:glutamate carboxypeptidase
MDPLLAGLESQRSKMLAVLEKMVRLESPSHAAAAVNCCVDYVAGECQRLGGKVTRHSSREYGDALQADFLPPSKSRGRILLLGHLDTVWELGTLRRMPYRLADGRAWGPGVLDMKSGVTQALFALQALRALRFPLPKHVTLLLNPDEEVGSHFSRPITERIAKTCDAVLVLEPGTGWRGALKTARKGVGLYEVRVHGRAAHAGVDFHHGVSATLELARQIPRITSFTSRKRGLTVNVGVIRGGTRSNVVAEEAVAMVDVRVARLADAAPLDRKFRALRPFHPEARIEIAGGLNRPPMERSPAGAALFAKARDLGRGLGLDLEESSTGGGSDGNFTAGLGIPTLDGLGGAGEGAHAVNESIRLDLLAPRAALLARLLLEV